MQVTDIKAFFTGTVMNAEVKDSKGLTDDSFVKAIDEASSRTSTIDFENDKQEVKPTKTVVKTDVSDKVTSTRTGNKPVEEEDAKAQKAENIAEDTQPDKEITDKIDEKIDEIKESIKDKLSVSDEDIEAAMVNLGLMPTDLLNVNDVKSLMMELSGENDPIALLTNENLLSSIKEVTDLVSQVNSQLLENFNLNVEQLEKICDFMDSNVASEFINDFDFDDTSMDISLNELGSTEGGIKSSTGVEISTDEATVVLTTENGITSTDNADTSDNAFSDNTGEEGVEGEDNAELIINASSGTVNKNAKINSDSKAEKEADSEETPITVKENTTESTKTITANNKKQADNQNTGNKSFTNNTNDDAMNETNQPINTTVEITTDTNGNVVETVREFSTGYADTQRILSQVTDNIKVNIDADTTSMEMQLHPASLGTVNLHISSSGGTVSAHLTVQNETVKAVLESQMVQLLDTFAEQGQKVETIEVSVANYDLDRSLSQNNNTGNDQQKQEDNKAVSGVSRRRLNLSELSEEDIEALSDEEQLAVEMMEMNGTSVDYKA